MVRKTLVALIVLGALLGVTVGATAGAGASPVTTVNLLGPPGLEGECSVGALAGTAGFGTAGITSGHTYVSTSVSLQGAAPNTAYGVSIVQTPNGDGCTAPQKTFTTNASGARKGVHLSVRRDSTTCDAFIAIFAVDGEGSLIVIASGDISLGGSHCVE
jgi:hypothetical protein